VRLQGLEFLKRSTRTQWKLPGNPTRGAQKMGSFHGVWLTVFEHYLKTALISINNESGSPTPTKLGFY